MRKQCFFVLLLMFLSVFANAQRDYTTSLGMSLGPFSGISAKHFVSDKNALEGVFAGRWSGSVALATFQRHQSAFNKERLFFYYGGGFHVGWWNLEKRIHPWFKATGDYTVFGLTTVGGIEYTVLSPWMTFSLDWKPLLNLTGYSGFHADGLSISIRFILQ